MWSAGAWQHAARRFPHRRHGEDAGRRGAGRDTRANRLRGLRRIRLSVLTDEITSPERQREADDRAAASLNIDFGAGEQFREAADLDVSVQDEPVRPTGVGQVARAPR